MNLLDYALMAILGYCLVRGIFRGLIKELSSIVGVLGGYHAAYSYYPQLSAQLSKFLSGWIPNPAHLNIISFLLLFVLVFLFISLAGVVIKYLVNVAFLGWTDRICGAVFGTAKGLLIVSVLLLMLTTFLPKNAALLRDSWGAHHLMRCSSLLVEVTPKEMKQRFEAKEKELIKSWQKK